MSVKHQIRELIKEGKQFEEIVTIMKDAPVKSVFRYVRIQFRRVGKGGEVPKKRNQSIKGGVRIMEDKHTVTVTCRSCKRVIVINTNDRSLYTQELRDNYICIFCKPRKPKRRK